MKHTTIYQIMSLAFALLISSISIGQNTVNGTITGSDGEPLFGANVIVKGTSEGTITDLDGYYSLSTSQSFPLTLVYSFTGFNSQERVINGVSSNVDIVLSEGIFLGEDIVISASRRREKVQEAPASVSVIGARQLSVSPSLDPARTIINLPGVTVQQQSAGRINVELRGANGAFATSTFSILDYRNLVAAGTGSFFAGNTGINTIDLERVEVVRGPGSALYGAGVTSGVVHYISKSPIDDPGTTVEVIGGELNTFGIAARHATKVSDKFGFKINANYRRGDEFGLDPNDPTDAATIAALSSTISEPTVFNGRIDAFAPGSVLVDDLDDDGDGNPLLDNYFNFTVNATLEFRPSEDLSINLTGGGTGIRSLFFNNQGEGIGAGNNLYTQARVQYKGLFAQVFFSDDSGGFDSNPPTSLFRTGLISAIARQGLESQIQYNFEIPSANVDVTAGFDTRQVFSESRNTTFGRNEDIDDYGIFGGYVQAKWAISPKFDILGAGRYDSFDFLDEGFFSPRAALVYKPDPNHTFRASFNIAGDVPSALDFFLDFPVAAAIPGIADIWFSGGATTHFFDENSVIDLTIPGFPSLPLDTPGLPLALPYGAVTPTVLQFLGPQLGSDPLGIIPFLQSFVPQGTTGTFVGFNIFDGTPLTPQNNAPLPVASETTYEIGYSGFIQNKLKLTIDVYNRSIDGALQFTALAPAYSLIGADSGGGLAAEVGAALTTHLVGLGVPQEVAAGTAAGIAAAYAGAGAGFDDPVTGVGALYALIGAAESGIGAVPLDDDIVHIATGNQVSVGDISYTGVDFGASYYLTNNLIGYFNYSWLSQTEWFPGEDDVQNPFSLNTPDNKFRLGVQYLPEVAWSGSLAFQRTPSYNATFGLFSGITDEQNLVDLSVGYKFDSGLKVGLDVNNLFDSQYRFAPSLPTIGRIALAKLTYTL